MMAEFFTKYIFLFNYITNTMIVHSFNLLSTYYSRIQKIFQNDKVDERDENESDGDEIPEFCENGEGFATGSMFT